MDAAASDFLDDVSVSAEYKIWDIASRFQDAQIMDVSISDALDDIRSDKLDLYDDLSSLIPAWAADPDDVTLSALIEDKISDISDLNDDEFDILDDFYTRLQSDIADLLDDLDDITTSNDMDANMQYVLAIRMNMTADENAALSAGELEDLEDIANQCHLDGGDAVYVARNILRGLGEEIDDDYDICNPSKPLSQTNTNFNKDVKLYPNPGSGTLDIDLTNIINVSASLTLTDLLGNIKISGNLNEGHNSIETAQLPTGIYVATIEFANGSQKIIKWIKE